MGGPGSGGHNRKGEQEHKLSGTYRKDRHKAAVQWENVPPAPVEPPRWFGRNAKKFWREHRDICTEMGSLDMLSLPLFEALCCTFNDLREMDTAIKEQGTVVNNKPHPLMSAYNRAFRDFGRLAAEFGLTPAGRKRLGIEWPPAKSETDPFTDFLRSVPGGKAD